MEYADFDILWGMDKELIWKAGPPKTPPFSRAARILAGHQLRLLQKGETLSMPQSRPMPQIGARVHELRIKDEKATWRIIYRIDPDAIVIVHCFDKDTNQTPKPVVETCKARIKTLSTAG